MAFVAQRLPGGRGIRVMTAVDQYTRECVPLLADKYAERREDSNSAGEGAVAVRRSSPLAAAVEKTAIEPQWKTLRVSHYSTAIWLAPAIIEQNKRHSTLLFEALTCLP